MSNRYIILTAQVVSLIFSPHFLPLTAFIILLSFSYMRYTPVIYNLFVIGLVFLFTIALPRLGIYLYRRLNGWTRHQLSRRERRYVPYGMTIISYGALICLMDHLRMPRFMTGVLVAALAIQIACAAVNPLMKVSTHAAASGGVVGAIAAFGAILGFNPTSALCAAILMAGMVGTARLILRQHTPAEVGAGTLIGIICALAGILLA